MGFAFTRLDIPDLILVEHPQFKDARGFFMEAFRENVFLEAGLPRFVQDNHSRSVRGVLRGLHYQIEPASIGKLVRCSLGRIFDVAVDIRRGSPTCGKWLGVELADDDGRMLYLPPGFAHGVLALSDVADVTYKVTGYWSPAHERTIVWNDPDLRIGWPLAEPLLGPKDEQAPRLRDAENNFVYPA